MPAYPRSQIVPTDEIGIYHCIARCVRRAFLCGVDPFSGRDYEHRKDWIRQRLEQLAAIFAIEICGYAVMSNHLHLILRIRPDLAQGWSDEELALRWLRLFPPRDSRTGQLVEPAQCDLNRILSNPARIAEIRQRLANLSWFMRSLSEPIARQANREDRCTGRFWEGRFKSQALLDEAAILACSIYVDLNPIRAGVAPTPEQSPFTSAFDRIQSLPKVDPLVQEQSPLDPTEFAIPKGASTVPALPNAQRRPDSWLCELTLVEGPSETPAPGCPLTAANAGVDSAEVATVANCDHLKPRGATRASNRGYLPMSVDKYLALLDWTGRQLRTVSSGSIPAQLAPNLERLRINSDGWVETVRRFGRWFKTAAGRGQSLKDLASRRGNAWVQGQNAAALAFR
jgi:REP element-mobilizing transposase RayT